MIDRAKLRQALDRTIEADRLKQKINLQGAEALVLLRAAEAFYRSGEPVREAGSSRTMLDHAALIDRAREAQASGTILLLRPADLAGLVAMIERALELEGLVGLLRPPDDPDDRKVYLSAFVAGGPMTPDQAEAAIPGLIDQIRELVLANTAPAARQVASECGREGCRVALEETRRLSGRTAKAVEPCSGCERGHPQAERPDP